jgi:hypothetical protein
MSYLGEIPFGIHGIRFLWRMLRLTFYKKKKQLSQSLLKSLCFKLPLAQLLGQLHDEAETAGL